MDEKKPIETLKEAYWWLNDKNAVMVRPPIYELLQQVSDAQKSTDQSTAIRVCQNFCETEIYMPADLKKLVDGLLDAVKLWDPETETNEDKIEEASKNLRNYGGSFLQNTYPYILSLRKAVGQNPDEAWNVIERLCAISKKLPEQLEAGEMLVECAWAAYQLKNNYRAVELLENANRFYNTHNHQKAVVHWIIGCLHWASYQPEKAHIAWRFSLNHFEQLSTQRMMPPGTDPFYYRDILEKLKATLEYAVANEHQQAEGAAMPPESKTATTPPPPDEVPGQKKEKPSEKQEKKAERGEPVEPEEEWFVSYSGDLIETFPVVSKVPAGRWKPTPDDPNMIGKVEIGPVWIENKPYVTKYLGDKHTINLGVSIEKHVVIKIIGDSMNNAKPYPIEDNDYILLRLQDDADSGDIVAAKIYDEATRGPLTTIKRLSKRGTKIILKPESTQSTYPDLEGDIQIVGHALAVFKPARKQ